MAASAVAAHVYESVRRRSPYPRRRGKHRTDWLLMWLALVAEVVVVGGFAFGRGFLGVVAARSLGWGWLGQ